LIFSSKGVIELLILDSHAHCGLTLPFERIRSLWDQGDIHGGVLFSPVEEIYDRGDRNFVDSPEFQKSRDDVHKYLESLKGENIYIFWFVWNDFSYPGEEFSGIKWHRHASEPKYLYGTKECDVIIEDICERQLPVILEEEFSNTLMLIEKFEKQTITIIPHLGNLNGGYERLKEAGVFENPFVYVDTSLASPYQVKDFVSNYGSDRIMFGSDYPFGDPVDECVKIKDLFSGEDLEKILAKNLLNLLYD